MSRRLPTIAEEDRDRERARKASHRTELDTLRARVAELETERDRLVAEVSKLDGFWLDLSSECQHLRTEMKEVAEERDALRAELREFAEALGDAQTWNHPDCYDPSKPPVESTTSAELVVRIADLERWVDVWTQTAYRASRDAESIRDWADSVRSDLGRLRAVVREQADALEKWMYIPSMLRDVVRVLRSASLGDVG